MASHIAGFSILNVSRQFFLFVTISYFTLRFFLIFSLFFPSNSKFRILCKLLLMSTILWKLLCQILSCKEVIGVQYAGEKLQVIVGSLNFPHYD